ncbi:prion-like-(Q/N-rich) domain-bearing protein 25 [Mercenaria mercenaria]|uniref:prion-like-(Q/N-rich) domain-bearing protein 25 n=1 Tax=Mercenaria mercenaria TaxID=6596 RepID=UPI00234EC70F|nr:prion-like-(Q/N-rich) domain-bearing protein 25 [Mercenaria mercenaria]
MASRIVDRDFDTKSLDKGLRNGWKWEWLEKKVDGELIGQLGRSCANSSECNDAAVICDSQVCKCITATYYDNNGNGTMGGSCVARHGFGATCTDPNSGAGDYQCSTANAICKADTGSSNPTTYSCQCGDGFVQDGTSCLTVRYLNQGCTINSQCAQVNSECRTSECQCVSGYYQDGTGSTGTCSKSKLGEGCSSNAHCDTVTNAVCNGNVCVCNSGYYDTQTGIGGSCQSKF